MQNYTTIIFFLLDFFILINFKKLKTIKSFISLLGVIQVTFVLCIFYADNNFIMHQFINNFKEKFISMFLYIHKIIAGELNP